MRGYLIAFAAIAVLTPVAQATTIGGLNFDLTFSDPVDIGDGLLQTTLSATGRGEAVLASFDGTIGDNGGLHHEQFPTRSIGIFPTPTNSDTDSAVDSHFLLDVQLSIIPLTEDQLNLNNLGTVPGRDSFGAGNTGFGSVLSGNVTLNNPAPFTPIAQLVFAAEGEFTYDFALLPQSAIGGTERFSGTFRAIPEPSTALMVTLGLASIVARRRLGAPLLDA